ncbi:peptidoglycan DD-metalloendopeptidase family protein [Catenulispora yoronensis]|uniref:peptidoglycan DD-metalloendopeptidase family protein n=1 Tax=Catenulispora yoronensis TaxID=450799 RepID=UPI0031D46B4C
MRLIKTLAPAAAIAGLSLVLPALVHSGPRPSLALAPAAAATPGGAGVWTWPLVPPVGASRPVVVRGFEPPAERWRSGHRGVDLLGGGGQEVVAAGAGVVSFAGSLFGRGVVAVEHGGGRGGLRTTYEPVDPVVRVGERVRGGQVIGHLVGSGVSHCAPRVCLHWGLVRGVGHGVRYLDPGVLVGRGVVRLLPVWGVG